MRKTYNISLAAPLFLSIVRAPPQPKEKKDNSQTKEGTLF